TDPRRGLCVLDCSFCVLDCGLFVLDCSFCVLDCGLSVLDTPPLWCWGSSASGAGSAPSRRTSHRLARPPLRAPFASGSLGPERPATPTPPRRLRKVVWEASQRHGSPQGRNSSP